MRMRALRAFLLLSCLVLAACDQTSIVTAPQSPRTPGSLSSSSVPCPALPTAPLSVYIGSTDGAISALNAANGTVRWRSQVANASTSNAVMVAALADGVVYAMGAAIGKNSTTTFLYALRASDGSILWQKTLVGAGAVIAARACVVYFALGGAGATPNEIQMLRAEDGTVLWHTQVAGTGPLHASEYQGTIYVTSFTTLLPSPGYYYASTHLYALNTSSGAIDWHSQVSRTNYVAAVANGAVYLIDTGADVVCDPKVLHVLSASDGKERWQVAGTLLNLTGVEQGRTYVTDIPEGCNAPTYEHIALSALNADDGSSVWQIDLQSQYYGGILANSVIYLPGVGNALAAYSARNGALLWHAQGESGRLWMLDGDLYAALGGMGLSALNPATGAVRWRYGTSDLVTLSTVVHGILYGVSSHQSTDSLWTQALVAITARDGKLRWRFPIGTSEDSPIIG